MVERAVWSQVVAALSSSWGQNQSIPVSEVWRERNWEVMGSAEGCRWVAARIDEVVAEVMVWEGNKDWRAAAAMGNSSASRKWADRIVGWMC